MSSTYYQNVTKPRTKWLQIAVAAGAAIALTAGIAAKSFAVSSTEVNVIDGTQGWAEWHRDTGSVTLASEFGAPDGFGTSALNFATPLSNDKAYVKNTELVGQNLAVLEELSYSTFRDGASTFTNGVVPALNVEIMSTGTSGYTTLVFEPIYQTGGAGAVQTDTWQNWDALLGGDAKWWSTNTISGVTDSDITTSPYDSRYVSWADIVAANPEAKILSVSVNQGGGNQGLFTGADAVSINNMAYDFEAAVVEPVVNGENFNTHASSDYEGVNVGYNLANFDSVTSTTVSLLDSSRNVIVTNTGTQALFDLYNNNETKQFSTPFITELGSYDLAGDIYWDFGAWKSTAKPVYAQITVNGVVEEITPLTEADGILFSDLTFSTTNKAKEACKNNGWKVFSANYKNQGQCVASVVSNSNSAVRQR